MDRNSLEDHFIVYLKTLNVYNMLSRNFNSRIDPTSRFTYVNISIYGNMFTTAFLEIAKDWH